MMITKRYEITRLTQDMICGLLVTLPSEQELHS